MHVKEEEEEEKVHVKEEKEEEKEEEEVHVTFPTNHHWRNFPRENFANASPSDRKPRIQS